MIDNYYFEFARAYLAGSGYNLDSATTLEDLQEAAKSANLKLYRFKRKGILPRAQKVIGTLKAFSPRTLLDVGSGRGTFLWPMMDALPWADVTTIEIKDEYLEMYRAIREGGLSRLQAYSMNVCDMSSFPNGAFDGITLLEVLEHLPDLDLVKAAVAEACRVADRFIIVSVPSKEDNNPEHFQLFTPQYLEALFHEQCVNKVQIEYVLNHMVLTVTK